MFISFKSIRKRQSFWLSTMALVPLLVFSVIFFLERTATLKENSLQRLVAIRDLKAQQVNTWLAEKIRDGQILAEAITYFADHAEDQEHLDADIKALLNTYEDQTDSYDSVFLVESGTGRIFLSGRPGSGQAAMEGFSLPTDALKSRQLYISDIHLSASRNAPVMVIAIPVVSDAIEAGTVLAFRINLADSLYRTLSERTALGTTGEVYIVGREGRALSHLRKGPDASLGFRLSSRAAANGASGKTGVLETTDYLGDSVLAAYTYLPMTGWGFVVKQDTREIYAPVIHMLLSVALLALGIMLATWIIAQMLSRELTQPVLDMADVAKRIMHGESGLRNKIVGNDEISFLASTFNDMAGALEGERNLLIDNLKNVIGAMPSALICVDKDHNVVIWNDEAVNLSGVRRRAAVGNNVLQVMPILSDYKGNIEQAIEDSTPFQLRGLRHGTNAEIRFYDITMYPVRSLEERGAVIRIDDVTREVEKDEWIRQTQKMDAVGNLTGGIAHDFNNILGIILGYADLLREEMREGTRPYEFVSEIKSAAERASNLTAKLLSFSRKDAGVSEEVVNVNEVLEDERELLSKTLTANIELRMDLYESVWPVFVDVVQLQNAILNLCINSMHAMPEGGAITLTTRNTSLGSDDVFTADLRPGDYVKFSVADTGAGISRGVQKRVFEPFFTTKGFGGTGLGLSQVYGFAQQSGGTIQLSSEPHRGTCIDIYLPRFLEDSHQVPDDVSPEQGGDAKQYGGNETILVVDDEPALLALASEILAAEGYNVITACNGKEALSVLEREEGNIPLVICDVIMPEMGGYELSDIVKKRYPATRMQMVSGFADDRAEKNIERQDLSKNLLGKPFSRERLLQQTRAILDQGTDNLTAADQ